MSSPDQHLVIELRTLASSLEANPVFDLSLNSKELFHSNLLARFFTHHLAAGADLLAHLGVSSGDHRHQVLREHRNLDLAIKMPGRRQVIIENKVFDIPNDEQLRRYAEKTGDASDLILLSLTPPDWLDGTLATEHGTWRFVSYAKLAKGLAATLDQVDDDFERALLRRYCATVCDLDKVARLTALTDRHEPIDFESAIGAELSRIRVLGAMGKRRAQQAVGWLKEDHALLPVSHLAT